MVVNLSIEIAKKIADELGVIVDKKLMKRFEDIEALLQKEKIFDYIELIIRDLKIKKAHAA